MPVSLHHIVIDAHDLPALARFWAEVLRWRILSEREREVVIGPDETAPVGICFMPVTDRKVVKNRLHLDLTWSWTVLSDPEENEFCVVRPKETLIG
ncbi:VOC family protein [Streptomyces mirabilis]|uniref:VOC family protein n=1 Tax=Streptomyces mirabilis TaxID=68239 RepID=UPI00364D9F9B